MRKGNLDPCRPFDECSNGTLGKWLIDAGPNWLLPEQLSRVSDLEEKVRILRQLITGQKT
ncbi:MAG: hypothetical protein ACYC6N_19025 [Pirellulaceae bacterium]